MKKTILSTMILGTMLVSIIPNIASAQDNDNGFYVKAGLNNMFQSNFTIHDDFMEGSAKLKNSLGYELGFGYNINNFAAEFMYSSNKSELREIPNFNVDFNTFMLNGYYYFDNLNTTTLKPYVKVGLGQTAVAFKYYGDKSTDNQWTYALGAGLNLNLTTNFSLFTEIDYRKVENLSYSGDTIGFGTNGVYILTAGAKYRF